MKTFIARVVVAVCSLLHLCACSAASKAEHLVLLGPQDSGTHLVLAMLKKNYPDLVTTHCAGPEDIKYQLSPEASTEKIISMERSDSIQMCRCMWKHSVMPDDKDGKYINQFYRSLETCATTLKNVSIVSLLREPLSQILAWRKDPWDMADCASGDWSELLGTCKASLAAQTPENKQKKPADPIQFSSVSDVYNTYVKMYLKLLNDGKVHSSVIVAFEDLVLDQIGTLNKIAVALNWPVLENPVEIIENQKFEIGKGKVNKTLDDAKLHILGSEVLDGYPQDILIQICSQIDLDAASQVKYGFIDNGSHASNCERVVNEYIDSTDYEPLNKAQIFAYYVNLEDATDRHNCMNAQLNDIGIPHERFPAVTLPKDACRGDEFTPDCLWKHGLHECLDFDKSLNTRFGFTFVEGSGPGAWANDCSHSLAVAGVVRNRTTHLEKAIINGYQPKFDTKYWLLLEDDVFFNPNIVEKLDKLFVYLMNQGLQWDALQLDPFMKNQDLNKCLVTKNDKFKVYDARRHTKSEWSNDDSRHADGWFGGHAILIKDEAMEKYFTDSKITGPKPLDYREFDIDLSLKYLSVVGDFVQQPAMFRPNKPWSRWAENLDRIVPSAEECANYESIEVSEINPQAKTTTRKMKRIAV